MHASSASPFRYMSGCSLNVPGMSAQCSLHALPASPSPAWQWPGAGTGLDFSAASSVVFAELPSEVAVVQQAEDRAHRQGQQLPVNVYFLLGRGTTDERRCGARGSGVLLL